MPTSPANNLKQYQLLQLSGDNVKTFLQGQLSCNLEAVNHQQSMPFCYCNVKGRVLALGWAILWQHDYYLICQTDCAPLLMTTLLTYARLSRVAISLSEHWYFFGIQLTHQHSHGQCIAGDDHLSLFLPEFSHLCLHIMQKQTLDTNTLSKIYPQGVILTDQDWQIALIKANLPTLNVTTQCKYTPQMLNAVELGYVDFTKGCYLGQEIIARTHNLGKRKRCLISGSAATKLTINSQIKHHEEVVGQIIATADDHSKDLYFALAVVSIQAANNSDDMWLTDDIQFNRLPSPYQLIP